MKITLEQLLEKPLWQMSGEEFFILSRHAAQKQSEMHKTEDDIELCTGVKALAEKLACCESTIYMLKREGILNEAVKSQIGKKIVFNVEKARELANEFQKRRRKV